jgi:hypothetical protein
MVRKTACKSGYLSKLKFSFCPMVVYFIFLHQEREVLDNPLRCVCILFLSGAQSGIGGRHFVD